MNFVIVILFFIALIFAFMSLNTESSINSIVYMVVTSICFGLLYLEVGAIYAGIFQLLIYAGVLAVLFAVTSYVLESKPIKKDEISTLEVGFAE